MSLMGFLVLLIIAAICGNIGQALAGYSMGGCITSVVVGFIGAYIGLWLADKMDFPVFWTIAIQGKAFPVVWAIIGSALFSLVIGTISRGKKGKR